MKWRNWQWMGLALCVLFSLVLFYRGHQVSQGRMAFERLGCPSCHLAGGAPSLEHVGRKYDRRTFVEFIGDPQTIYTRRGNQPLNPGYLPMPRLQASRRDIVSLSYFLAAQR